MRQGNVLTDLLGVCTKTCQRKRGLVSIPAVTIYLPYDYGLMQ